MPTCRRSQPTPSKPLDLSGTARARAAGRADAAADPRRRSSARSSSSANGGAAADDRARPPRVDGPVGPARQRQDDARAAARRGSRCAVRDAVGGDERRGRRARGHRQGAGLDRPPAAGRPSCSSTRSTASTRASRTRCCPRSRTARSRSSAPPPRTRTSRSTRRCCRGCACSGSSH